MNKLLHARMPKWPRRLISPQNAIFTQFQTLNDPHLKMFCNPTNLPDNHDSNVAFQMSGKEFSIIIFEELKNDSCPGFEDFLKIQFPSLRPSITEI